MQTINTKLQRNVSVNVPVSVARQVQRLTNDRIAEVMRGDELYKENIAALDARVASGAVQPWMARSIEKWLRADCIRRHGQTTGEWL